jgi:hypothetical protein
LAMDAHYEMPSFARIANHPTAQRRGKRHRTAPGQLVAGRAHLALPAGELRLGESQGGDGVGQADQSRVPFGLGRRRRT